MEEDNQKPYIALLFIIVVLAIIISIAIAAGSVDTSRIYHVVCTSRHEENKVVDDLFYKSRLGTEYFRVDGYRQAYIPSGDFVCSEREVK